MYTILITSLIIIGYAAQTFGGFSIKPISLEKLNNTFRISLPDESGIKMVDFHININKAFRSFAPGELSGLSAQLTENGQWAYEFPRQLQDADMIYVWLTVQYKSLLYRAIQGPISASNVPAHMTAVTISLVTSNSTEGNMNVTPSLGDEIHVNACLPTITELSSGEIYCKDDILFEDNFNDLDRWISEVRLPLDTSDAEFAFYNGSVSVENGTMKIQASLSETSLTRGVLNLLERCTSFNPKECYLEAKGSFFLPPVASARINSRNSFSFKYGRIEVRAKLPKGDWLVPIIALQPTLPKYGPVQYINGEMRIAFARGNYELTADNSNIDGQRLFGGVIFSKRADLRHQFMANVTLDEVNGLNEHFGNQYHLYSMIWKPQEILLSVDGYQYGKISTNFKEITNEVAWRLGPENAPLDQMFHISLGLSVGGHGDFPNNAANKPWTNGSPRAILEFYKQRGDWRPTWEQPELHVDYIKVYAV